MLEGIVPSHILRQMVKSCHSANESEARFVLKRKLSDWIMRNYQDEYEAQEKLDQLDEALGGDHVFPIR